MATISLDKLRQLTEDGKRSGLTSEQIVNELVSRGHTIQGLNAPESSATFSNENWGEGTMNPIKNAAGFIGNAASDVFGMARHPVQTLKSIASFPVGVGELAGRAVIKATGTEKKLKEIVARHPEETGPIAAGFRALTSTTPEQQGVIDFAQTYGLTKEGLTISDPTDPNRPSLTKGVFEHPLVPALAVGGMLGKSTKASTAIDKGFEQVKVPEVVKKAGGKVQDMASGVGSEVLQKTTGLGQGNINTIIKNPDVYFKASNGEITKGSIAHEVKSAIENRMKEIGDAGSVYDKIRQEKGAVAVPQEGLVKILKKYGLEFQNGEIKVSAESRPLSAGDIKAIEGFMNTYGQPELSRNGFLNAREAAAKMADYDATRTDLSQIIARDIRGYLNDVGRPQIKGLDILDKTYGPERAFLSKVKQEYLQKTMDAEGHQVYTLKDTALSKIMNATNANRDNVLARLETLQPGIGKEIRVLKALEDVTLANGNKVGNYTRAGMVLTGVATMNLPMAVAAILSSPHVIVPILQWFGRMKGYGGVEDVVLKMQRGAKLTPGEKGFVSEGLKAYEEASNQALQSPQVSRRSTGEAESTSPTTLPEAPTGVNSESRLIELKGGKEGTPGINKAAPLPEGGGGKTIPLSQAKTGDVVDLPLSKIDTASLEPQPQPRPQAVRPITDPVEVTVTSDGQVILEGGNHRYHQAVFNGDQTIPAKIRFEKGADSSLLSDTPSPKIPKGGEAENLYQKVRRNSDADSSDAFISSIAHPYDSIGEKIDALSNLPASKRSVEAVKQFYNPSVSDIEMGKVYGIDVPTAEQVFKNLKPNKIPKGLEGIKVEKVADVTGTEQSIIRITKSKGEKMFLDAGFEQQPNKNYWRKGDTYAHYNTVDKTWHIEGDMSSALPTESPKKK